MLFARPISLLVVWLPLALCDCSSAETNARTAAEDHAQEHLVDKGERSLHALDIVGPHPRVTLQVEIASDARTRARGLMGRPTLAPNKGMLFVFDEEQEHTFWMHKTPLALDLVFFDSSGRLVGLLAQAEPNTDTPRSCGVPSRYVLEVRAGVAEQLGLRRGSQLDLALLRLGGPRT